MARFPLSTACLTLLLAAMMFLGPTVGTKAAATMPCEAGSVCELDGRLRIMAPGYPADGARLETSDGCVTLLLPPNSGYFDPDRGWNGKSVRVSGVAHDLPEDSDTEHWTYSGRGTLAGVCHDSVIFIYVDHVVLQK